MFANESPKFMRFSEANKIGSVDANACLNGSKSRLLNRDNLFLFRSRYVWISWDPINKFDNVEIDAGGSVGRQTDCFLIFFVFLLTESTLLLRHTFQGLFLSCFRRNRIFTLVSQFFFHFPSQCCWQWDGNGSMCGSFICSPSEKSLQGWN